MSELSRRAVLQDLAAAAAASTGASGALPIDTLDWESGGRYAPLSGTFDELIGHVHGEIIWSDLEADDFDDHTLDVRYDQDGVYLDIDGNSDTIGLGMLATLSDEQARDVAIALWQAVEEKQARNTGEASE